MQDRLGDLLSKRPGLESGVNPFDDEKDSQPAEDEMESYADLKDVIHRVQENARHIRELKKQSNKECTEDARKGINKDLRNTIDQTNELAKRGQEILKRCAAENEEYARKNSKSARLVFRQNMLSTHGRNLQDAMTDYQEAQSEYKRAQAETITRQAKLVNKDISEDEIESLLQSDDPLKFMKEQMMIPHSSVIDRVAEIEERHEGMLAIEQGVQQIQELFNELAFLVELQGEKLQNIEDNVEQTKGYTEKAIVNVQKAEISQLGARRKMCYILICCVVLLAIVLLAVLVPVLN